MTLKELGEHFGFSRERARQLEIRAKEKLKQELHALAAEIDWPTNGGRSTSTTPRSPDEAFDARSTAARGASPRAVRVSADRRQPMPCFFSR